MKAEELARIARARAVRHELALASGNCVYYEYPAKGSKSKTLIMIHGYRGNHHGLEAIAAGLPEYRLVIPDLPGFGESAALQNEHSLKNYSHWLSEFLEAIGEKKRPHLMGHSFGTLVVGTFAATNNVSSIILVNPVSQPALKGPRAALTTLAKIYYLLAGFAPRVAGEWLLRNKIAVMVMSIAMAKTKDKPLRKWIHRQHLDNFSDFSSIAVAVQGYQASISLDLSQLAEKITAPVLVIAADLDDITDVSEQRRVSRLYVTVNYQEIRGVGHLVHYEAPDQAATFIQQFLDQL